MKGLINLKNNDNKCFLLFHSRHLNPPKITWNLQKQVMILIMKAFNLLSLEKILTRLKRKIIFALMCFIMKIIYFILFIYRMKNLKIVSIYWLRHIKKSRYVYIKNFNRFMCNKTSSEKVLVEHKGICLQMNRKQAVKLGSGSIKFKSHFKQLAVLFNFHADFESVLKGVRGSDTKIILHTLKNIRNTFLAALPTKLLVLVIYLVKQLFFTGI